MQTNPNSESRVLRPKEVAELLGLSVRQVRVMLRRGALPRVRLGVRAVGIRESRLIEWLKAREDSGKKTK